MLDSAKQTGIEQLRVKLNNSWTIKDLSKEMQDIIVDLCVECYSMGFDTCKDIIHVVTK